MARDTAKVVRDLAKAEERAATITRKAKGARKKQLHNAKKYAIAQKEQA